MSNFADRIECVLLNACDSEPLADEISKHINYAIRMNRPAFDDAAIALYEVSALMIAFLNILSNNLIIFKRL
ncbi:MAG: hypothetical protein AAGA80_25825 [Cyanobacteria bacterium P01_F01_bin.143]